MKCADCILDLTDACPRGSGRAIDDDICDNFVSGETKEYNGHTYSGVQLQACIDGYKQGAEDMEKAKQIIIDGLLAQIENIRADAIEEAILVAEDGCLGIHCDNCPCKQNYQEECEHEYILNKLRELKEQTNEGMANR